MMMREKTQTPVFSLIDYGLRADYFRLFENLNTNIYPDESVALLGPTGSGKSLLLSLFQQTLWDSRPKLKSWQRAELTQSGRLIVLGIECSPEAPSSQHRSLIQSQIALVRDQSIWFPNSIAENFEIVQRLCGAPQIKSYSEIVKEFAPSSRTSRLLMGLAEQFPQDIELPYRQFLAIIRALVRRPQVMLLDEALIRLDPILLRHSETLLNEKSDGMTLIWATNDLYQASRATDRTILLSGGRICEDSETNKFFTSPQTIEAENFISGKDHETSM